MQVRKAKAGDAAAVSKLFYETVRNVNKADYSPEQIEAWAPRVREDAYWTARWDEEYEAFVVEGDSGILGFCELRSDGRIGCFFVHHRHQGQGVGALLMRQLQARAQGKSLDRLFADVSITAKSFFLSKGFQIIQSRIKAHNGINFQIYDMENNLLR